MNIPALNRHIDYTLLKPGMTGADVRKLCKQAVERKYFAVCIPGGWVDFAAHELNGTGVKVCSVAGFPLGHSDKYDILNEVSVLASGKADEIDLVFPFSVLELEGKDVVTDLLRRMQLNVTAHGKILKVILESGIKDSDELKRLCDICAKANVDYVKTSTGFAGIGAEPEKVEMMRRWLPNHIRIKASGGIRTAASAEKYLQLGADRIGTSTLI